MGYKVFKEKLHEITFSKKPFVINTINAYSYIIAKRDSLFKKTLKQSDILVADGFPVVIAAKFLRGTKITKIAGADVFEFFCKKLDNEKGRCFFLGSSENTLKKIEKRLKLEFPNISSRFYSPPFKSSFSTQDNLVMVKEINDFSPDVLFVGMTAPKQEKWVYQNLHVLHSGVICSIGAVFDFYAGTIKRPSDFWVKLNMEWFIRLLREPLRLWKRYLIYSPMFFYDMILFKLRIIR
ncbi:MAG: WecB/TagA/CpsF family glycosyltransferase [Bacteroidales bacterium]|nr:WecB/TagA/CpsF family glycosyltransferase [Bacteroidales bacterium]